MNFGDYIEIALSCCSDRLDVSLGCGITYENKGQSLDLSDTDWIWTGLAECFWENFFEFEEGMALAKAAESSGKKPTLCEALHDVFGVFTAEYSVNGEVLDLEYGVDVEEIIYNLLIESCDM